MKQNIILLLIKLGSKAVGKCIVPGLYESNTYEKINKYKK